MIVTYLLRYLIINGQCNDYHIGKEVVFLYICESKVYTFVMEVDAMKKEKKIWIRDVREEDAKTLLAIYAPYVEKTAISFEYDVPSAAEFKNRIENITKRYPYLVAEVDGELLGYCYASTFKPRRAYDHCVETTIYVREDCKGMGIGRALYERLEERLKGQGILNMNACIGFATREDDSHLNNASRDFHEHMGYELVGRFHKCGYKFGKWYDMIWMEKMIGEHRERNM